MNNLGTLTLTNISYEQAQRLCDAEFSSIVWLNGKSYPTDDIEAVWQDNIELRQQLAQQPSEHIGNANNMINPSDDTKRLNSGMIQIQTRDSFGEFQETHMRGLNLREAIDKAMNEAKTEKEGKV